MLKEFVEKILDLAPVEEFLYGGREYTTHDLVPVTPPLPKNLVFHTLDGLTSYLAINVDQLDKKELLILVDNHYGVTLTGKLDPNWKSRSYFARAEFNTKDYAFPFCQYLDAESFIIELQSKFIADDNLRAVLAIVGNMTTENVTTSTDDGVTQTVAARAGVSLKKSQEIPNPVVLRPYRTFLEVEQPASSFLLRVRQSREGSVPQCALFEADGGKWKLEAIGSIRRYLAVSITDVAIIA